MSVNPNATPGYSASYAGEIEKFIHVDKLDNLMILLDVGNQGGQSLYS